MNIRKIAYIILTLSIISLVSGGVSSFLISLRKDQVQTLHKINEVSDEFEVFSTNTSVFEEFRDNLYNDVLANVFYESLASDDILVKNKFSNYESLVDELGKNVNNMYSLCEDVYYPDGDANNKCSNYKDIYEQVVNYFVTDVNLYNKHIGIYNNYQASINSNLKIETYKTPKKYIDFNGDGVFSGKEE